MAHISICDSSLTIYPVHPYSYGSHFDLWLFANYIPSSSLLTWLTFRSVIGRYILLSGCQVTHPYLYPPRPHTHAHTGPHIQVSSPAPSPLGGKTWRPQKRTADQPASHASFLQINCFNALHNCPLATTMNGSARPHDFGNRCACSPWPRAIAHGSFHGRLTRAWWRVM